MKKYLCLLIILLSSCNNNDENKIAIVIHGGAGITVIVKNNVENDVLINQVGCFGLYLGRIDFSFDSDNKKIFNSNLIMI